MGSALVTGGTGTISSGIVEALVQNNYETYALTRGNMPYREIDGVKYLYLDKEDLVLLEKKLGHMKFDIVVECLVYDINQLKRSLNFFVDRCEQYIFISTTGIYKRENDCRIKEDEFTNLLEWKYARDKIECEEYLEAFGKKTGLNYTIVRPPVVYGDYRIPYPVVSRGIPWSLMQRMEEGRPVVSCNTKAVKYGILHISDFSRAVIGLIGNPQAYQEAFHIADHKHEYDWDEVLSAIALILAVDFHVIHIPIYIFKTTFCRLYDELLWNKIDDLMLDDTKIRQVTGFQAKVSLEEGLTKMISNMENEYKKYYQLLDDGWNRCCDHTILVATALQEIRKDEQKTAKEYIQRLKKEVYFPKGEMN